VAPKTLLSFFFEIWKFGNLEIWKFGNFEIWKFFNQKWSTKTERNLRLLPSCSVGSVGATPISRHWPLSLDVFRETFHSSCESCDPA